MTALLYISYSSKLTKEEVIIDLENRGAIIKFVKKGKIILVSVTFSIVILASSPKNVTTIGVGLVPPRPIVRYSNQLVPRYTQLIPKKQGKITFVSNEKVFQKDQIYSNLLKKKPISTVDRIVELRGGDMNPLTDCSYKWIELYNCKKLILKKPLAFLI